MKQFGLVGCAHIHTPGFLKATRSRQDIQVKWVWDHNAARAQKNAEQLEARVTEDFNVIYDDPDITAVVVFTETNLHQNVVLPAVAAKKAIFVEKPLGMNAKDAYAIADAIENAGVIFQTGYFMRGDPKHIFLKNQIEQQNFGVITRVRGSNCHAGALKRLFDADWRWMADPKIAGVGAFGDLGTHSLDILIWLLGDVAAVTAQLDNGTNTYPGCDETGEAILRFKNNAIGTLAAGWDDLANPVALLISGTEGHAAIINDKIHFVSKKVPGCDGTQPMRNAELPPAKPAAMEAFLDVVTGKTGLELVGAREAAYRVAVMDAMYQGAAQKKWIEVKSSSLPSQR